jgi:hypothetical protein
MAVLVGKKAFQVPDGYRLLVHFDPIADRLAGPGANPSQDSPEWDGFPDLFQSFVHFALGQVMDIPLAVHPHRACLTAGRKLHAQVVQNADFYAPAAGRALVPIDPYIVIQAGE